jgi:hypothetical protein
MHKTLRMETFFLNLKKHFQATEPLFDVKDSGSFVSYFSKLAYKYAKPNFKLFEDGNVNRELHNGIDPLSKECIEMIDAGKLVDP